MMKTLDKKVGNRKKNVFKRNFANLAVTDTGHY